jgi:hypothetical protein
MRAIICGAGIEGLLWPIAGKPTTLIQDLQPAR